MAATTSPKRVKDPTWVPNATYPERPDALTRPLPVEKWIKYGMKHRRTVHFYGAHGTGKTSKIREIVEQQLGLRLVYINLANITPDDKLVSAPKKIGDGQYALQQMITEDLNPGEPFVVYLDDARQASQKVQNQFMQLTCGWEMGQHTLPDLVGVIMSDNEGATEGIRTTEDPAVADRKVTIAINANDTGWRYALAAKYKDTNLKKVFAVWDALTPELRHVLSPRCLDHVIYAALHGFPLIYGMPLMHGERVRLVTGKSGGSGTVDKTDEVLDKIAAGLGVTNPDRIPDLMNKVVRAALRDNLTVLIEGPPGCGKTELTKQLVRDAGLRQVYYSMPFTDPESLVIPMPTSNGTLKMLVAEELVNPAPYALIFDEYNRPQSQASFAKMMEMTQEWSIAGIPLSGCRAQIALCNPPTFMGRQMSVSKNNIAQADRFTLSVQVSPEDIPANEWLIATYGDVAETVLEWWKNDITDEQRSWITKRTLERFITLHQEGLPLENGKIYLGEGDFAPVPLIDLEARLAKRPKARLAEMAENIDEWVERLSKANELSDEGSDDTDKVHTALSLAELSQLWEHMDAVVRLLAYLPPKLKGTFFVGTNEEAQKFWIAAFTKLSGLDTKPAS